MNTQRRTRPRILFLEQFFWPEGWGGAELPRTLTMHLAQRGFDVEVICGTDQYAPLEEDAAASDPRRAGVRITRVPALWRGDYRRRKLLRQLWFYAAVIPRLLLRRPPDLMMQQTNPPLLVVLSALASWLWRRPLVVIAMDLYPEVVTASGMLGADDWRARLLASVFGRAYRRACRVVSLGPVMTERLRAKGVAPRCITEIQNWATGPEGIDAAAAVRLRAEWGLEGRFVVLYTGNLGVAHEFDTFLEGLAQAVRVEPRIVLVIVGRGSRLEEVRTRVAALSLGAHVCFQDFVPAGRLPAVLGLADVALVTLREGFAGLVVPSKLYGYLARALPVLYVGPRSDARLVVESSGAGVAVCSGGASEVGDALLGLAGDEPRREQMGRAARDVYENSLTASHALARYEAVVRECLEGSAWRASR